MEFDGFALVRKDREGLNEQGIEAVRADDKKRRDGFGQGRSSRAELAEQAGGVEWSFGATGEAAPELTLPHFVREHGGGELLCIELPCCLIGVPAGRPIWPIAGVAVELLGEELRESETVTGREGGRGIEAEVASDLIHFRQELPAQALGRPEGMGSGEISANVAGGEVPFEERARLEELEAHAEAEFAGELDL